MKKRLKRGLKRLIQYSYRLNNQNTTIVTGIPRSGTSLVTALLNQSDDILAVNETLNCAHTLAFDCWNIRRRIRRGLPIAMKVDKAGMPTSDTMDSAQIELRTIMAPHDQVHLIVNSNYPFLEYLERILSDGFPVTAIVRDPVYTICSWASRRARSIPESRVHPSVELGMHPRWRTMRFQGVNNIERQAELWNLMAGMILRHQAQIQVLHYEKICADITTLQHFSGFKVGDVTNKLAAIKSKNDPTRFSMIREVQQAVKQYCPNASLLGYYE